MKSVSKGTLELFFAAYAEDGHTAVNLLFRFENAADGALKWRCVAYDHGGGLTLLEPQAE